MMNERKLKYVLIADGTSDSVLIPILNWVFRQQEISCEGVIADFSLLRVRPKSLDERIRAALKLETCDILFIHRDSEKALPEERKREIVQAVEKLKTISTPPYVCVIPVRMTEAWLLFDVTAIRRAADNPNGRTPLKLPPSNRVEDHHDPKELLYDLLREASGLKGRRSAQFDVNVRVHYLADLITDFASLRSLQAFRIMETDVLNTLIQLGWK